MPGSQRDTRLGPGLRWRIRLARARQWEFWPTWLFYLPIVVWILLLGLRHRHFTLFTATNPGMDEGGVVGERKAPLLQALARRLPDATPRLALLPARQAPAERLATVHSFAAGRYPLVLKPDVGQRGRGVAIIRHPAQIEAYLAAADFDLLAQDFAAGAEYGAFIYRDPRRQRIEILSLAHKRRPAVRGDGRRRLADLILADPRARLSAVQLFERHAAHLDSIPAPGCVVELVELGSHCRGAVFESAMALATEGLRRRLAEIAAALPGFHFGRLDLIAPDAKALAAGRGLQILEVNGVTSEAAHAYHPGASLLQGYRLFFRQWALAFAIGAAHHAAGVPTVSPWRLLQLFRQDLARGTGAEACAAAAARLSPATGSDRAAATGSAPH